jgi:hypothetical protein
MKKMALVVLLLAFSSLSNAGGCWRNGKYVMCANDVPTANQEVSVQK